jgi:mono/diheme cytochrome c family protein
MNGKRFLLAAAFASAMLIAYGEAQEIGQPSRGLASARHLCAECHAVQKEQARSPNDNAPPFQVIASVPGMTATALSATLNTPHRTMPNIVLAAEEQADLIAYILSLK